MDRNTQQDEKLQSPHLLSNNRSRLWSSVIIDALIKGGVKNFYISPGMRNAPLIAALGLRQDINLFVVVDERAASYRALGASKVSGETSCLICTSGTAVANYLPALIEAKKSGTPLLAISADRPPELTFSDANQTIHQNRLFSGADIYSHSLQAPHDQVSLFGVIGEVYQALVRTRHPCLGPVHLNIPFREPLDYQNEEVSSKQVDEALMLLNNSDPYIRDSYPNQSLNTSDELLLKNLLGKARNPLLVIGSLAPFQIGEALKTWIQNFTGPKVLDVASSLKYAYPLEAGAIPTLEHQEVRAYFNTNPPDLILQLGGRLTSKFYYQFLEANPKIPLLVANPGLEREDPSFRVGHRFHGELESFARDLLPALSEQSNFKSIDFDSIITRKSELIDRAPLSYPVISKTLIEIIPDGSALYLGNSTVIRSFDSYASSTLKKDLTVLANRGVSGIEGLIASAVGTRDCLDQNVPLTLVNGDIATLHDLGSLSMITSAKGQLIVIVANNSCGGIFSLLPVAKEKEVADIIRSPQSYDYTLAAKLFNLKSKRVTTKDEFKSAYLEAIQSGESILIDVIFSDEDNTKLYQELKTVR